MSVIDRFLIFFKSLFDASKTMFNILGKAFCWSSFHLYDFCGIFDNNKKIEHHMLYNFYSYISICRMSAFQVCQMRTLFYWHFVLVSWGYKISFRASRFEEIGSSSRGIFIEAAENLSEKNITSWLSESTDFFFLFKNLFTPPPPAHITLIFGVNLRNKRRFDDILKEKKYEKPFGIFTFFPVFRHFFPCSFSFPVPHSFPPFFFFHFFYFFSGA